ncbi:AraC family transcriptional regulator [Pseudomonas sp. N040]|uniref:AraC family transcriptional regulator n=1 Tax=Pseudomonas sp. N040 TaxID=2785325 RepID=UPI0018A32A2C|nr:AraC family transcriptional regulator [Pseudomonas sp. N040]MBF7729231.1 AraC family transcriptional regulator [Pseudomonas sp. N040]MBW7012871.1 AraC family transcriptional regulator [Pseudomonas sp. N040]
MTTTPPLLVRARALTGFSELVTELGGNPAALLHEAGIDLQLLARPESSLGMANFLGLLENAAAQLDAPDFGLQLTLHQDFSVLGPIALVASRAETLGSALISIARNLPYHVARTSLKVEDGPEAGQTWLRYSLPTEVGSGYRQTVEMCCLLAVKAMRMLSGAHGHDWRVIFAHPPGTTAARYQALFECAVEFQQAGHGVIFPHALLEHPINGSNPQICAEAERFVRHLIRRNPLDLACQIEELIARQLAAGGCSLADIARQLSMHERTLQRRLDDQQIRFADILDRVRQQQAREYLRQPALPLPEVASLLGYSEQRSLSRACRRWFGTTPGALRAQS